MVETAKDGPIGRATKAPGWRREVPLVALLVLLAAAVRMYLLHVTSCISKDSAGYMFLAECLRQREFGDFLHNAQHHLFPVVLFVFQEIMGEGLMAAHGFNIALGALGVVPFYLLARNVFGARAAVASSMFFAFHVLLARSGAAIATEPLYLLLFLSALYSGKKALDTGDLFLFTLTGFLLGTVFMARPEGAGLWVILGGWALLLGFLKTVSALILRREYEPSGPRLFAGLVVMAVAAFLTITPHLLEVRFADDWVNEWRLTRKHSLAEFVQAEQVFSPSAEVPPSRHTPRGEMRHLMECLDELGDESLWGYHLLSTLPLFYLLGLFCRRSRPREVLGELILGSVAVAYLAAAFLLRVVHGYLTERHLLSSAVIVLMWAGPGFLAASDWMARLVARWDKLERSPTRVTAVALMLVTLGTMSLKTIEEIGWKKTYLPELGAQLRAKFPPPADRMTKVADFDRMPRLIFYGGGRPMNLERCVDKHEKGPERMVHALRRCADAEKPDLLMLCPDGAGACESELYSILEEKKLPPALVLTYDNGGKTDRVLVYRFQDLPGLTAEGRK